MTSKEEAKKRAILLKRLREEHKETVARTQALLKDQKAIRRQICKHMREAPKAVPEIAEKAGLPADQVLWLTAFSGEHPAPPRHIGLPLDAGITGLAAQQRQPIVVNDTGADPRYLEGRISGVNSEAAFPIHRGEQLFGVFDVTSARRGAFDEESVRTLTALGNQVAVALESAQLVAELQLMNKDLEAMLISQGELLAAVRELSSPVVPIFEG